MHTYLLSLCVLLPLVGVLVAVICPSAIWVRRFAVAVAGGEVLLCLYLGIHFDVDDRGIQFAERLDWIPELGVAYHLGIDGISLLPFVLTGLLLFVGLLARPATTRSRQVFALAAKTNPERGEPTPAITCGALARKPLCATAEQGTSIIRFQDDSESRP